MYQRLSEGPPHAVGGRWDAAPDLERFLSAFYRYFEVKGYRGVLALHLSHLVALAFTIAFSFFLLFFVDWHALSYCHSEESCRKVSLIYVTPFAHMSFWRLVVLLSFFLFSFFWVFNAVDAYQSMKDAIELSSYYKDRLGIVSDDVLATMTWPEVVSRLIKQQRIAPICVVQDELTALEIANIIMREDNFMIAFTNRCTFSSRLPKWIPSRLIYTRSVLWNLRAAVFNHIFDTRSRIRNDFLENPAALSQRLRYYGFLNLLLVLPVLVFVTILIFMRHAEEFRSHRASPFQRQWTDYARWTFREFNELPHQFKARMIRAQRMAEEYVQTTRPQSPVVESLQRCIKFVTGSILAVLLVVAVVDDAPLLFVKIQDKNLLWYLAFFGFLFTVADNAEEAPANQQRTQLRHHRRQPGSSTPLKMYCAMMCLTKCTHFLPPSWRAPAPLKTMMGSCGGATRRAKLCHHFAAVRKDLLRNFFLPRIRALLEELLGVVLTPLLFIFYFPLAADDIVELVRSTKHSSENLGDWCAFGCLCPSKHGSEFYGGPPVHLESGNFSDAQTELECGRFSEELLVSRGGKLEKSVISFILAYRFSWSILEDENSEVDGNIPQRTQGGTPVIQPTLGEEMRRGWQRLTSVSTARSISCGQANSKLMPLLQRLPDHEDATTSQELREFSSTQSSNIELLPRRKKNIAGDADFTEVSGQDVSPTVRCCEASSSHSSSHALNFQQSSPLCEVGSHSEADVIADACKEVWHDSQELSIDVAMCKAWGYSLSAFRLLQALEEYQERETKTTPLSDLYSFLPEELWQFDRVTPAMEEACVCPAAAWCEEEIERSSCSSHFFWLEVLYDYHSGRLPTMIPTAEGDWASFERSDMDSTSTRGSIVQSGCLLQ